LINNFDLTNNGLQSSFVKGLLGNHVKIGM
jgi:hypothetical protein